MFNNSALLWIAPLCMTLALSSHASVYLHGDEGRISSLIVPKSKVDMTHHLIYSTASRNKTCCEFERDFAAVNPAMPWPSFTPGYC